VYELVADQVFGLNGLVNLSNIVFLFAYSARDALKLRVLSLIGEGVILPYYYLQTEKLWPPICWGIAFMIVNGVRIVATIMERQPVVLSDREEELYRAAFSSIDKRDFLKLASLAQWVDCSPEDIIVKKGDQILEAIVLVSGEVEAVLGTTRMTLRPGHLVGDVSAYSGLASPADVVARSSVTFARWGLQSLREFTATRPELRANLLRIVSADLATKVRDVTTTASDLAGKSL
jgi:hypothetical protein